MEQTLSLSKWKVWMMAIRTRTLFNSMSPVLIGSVYCIKEGQFNPWIFILTLFCSLSIQIGTNLANDYFDFFKGSDTKNRIGPIRVTQSGLLSPKAVQRGFVTAFTITALCALPLILKGGAVIAVLTCVSILLGIFYTAGTFAIAYLGLGELFVFFFFGPIATVATAYLQMGHFSPTSLLIGLPTGALCCCVLIVVNLRDYEEDIVTKKKTLIVRFGKQFGKFEFLFFLVLALFIPLVFLSTRPLVCFATHLLAIPAFFLTRSLFQAKEGKDFIPFLKRTALLLVLFTLIFCVGWIV